MRLLLTRSMAVASLLLAPPHAATAPSSGHVVPASAMHAARMAHSATTLRDGRVLIAGGFTEADQAAFGAELYAPVTGRFTPTSPMHTLRHSHTATLLPDGRVLIAGGYGAGGRVLAEAELFDPATGRFSGTGAMQEPRAGQVAVPLADGTVLIAGGVGPEWRFLGSAEIYDPRSGRFTATGPMTVPRESHAAVRLLDGRVLVVGGHQGRREQITLYSSAETYDPITRRFQATGRMQLARHKHDAVLLGDGRVLVSGGSDARDNHGVYRSTELFDPVSGRFGAGPELSSPRYKHNGSSIKLPSGMVLMAGGAAQAELFDPVRREFASVAGADRLTGQFSAAALLPSGQALITGGYGADRGPQAAAWLYRP